ncbi:hypothetical protein TNCT_588801 [Trichonephila clavata]|uniref:Uncharacterized protein n=1 Tax=Trichonephila clavata TaxID=2740835 RepID=A0A8X6G3Z5_TRICU|nr:hypothetical protein TNCT_588801 [Trichonephila clavata]
MPPTSFPRPIRTSKAEKSHRLTITPFPIQRLTITSIVGGDDYKRVIKEPEMANENVGDPLICAKRIKYFYLQAKALNRLIIELRHLCELFSFCPISKHPSVCATM